MPLKVEECHWEITRSCNLSCKHRITTCGNLRPKELTKSDAIKAVQNIRSLNCRRVMITGGEPFFREDLFEILEELRLHKIQVSVLTNGVLVTPKLVKKISDLVGQIGISLDGSCSSTNDFIRGVGSFDGAIDAIKSLVEILPVYLYYTISKFNLDDVNNIVELSRSLGIKGVHFSEVTLRGRAYLNRSFLSFTAEQKIRLTELASRLTGVSVPDARCSANLSVLYLLSDGSVYPCTELAFLHPSLKMGHINDEDFSANLEQARKNFAYSSRLACCYSIYAGDGLVFLLNNKKTLPCPVVGRRYL